jgi:hypothetical protein
MIKQLCRNCGEEFEPAHGNQAFCSDECYREKKKEKQRENNSLVKQFSKEFLGNHQLFCQLLPESGEIKIPLWQLLKSGFDQDAFYQTMVDNKTGKSWHKVIEYLFRIASINNQPYLFLHKS